MGHDLWLADAGHANHIGALEQKLVDRVGLEKLESRAIEHEMDPEPHGHYSETTNSRMAKTAAITATTSVQDPKIMRFEITTLPFRE